MNTEAHLAVGWVLGNIAREDSRRWRAMITVAALLPDIDTLSDFWGERAYADIHHAVGHNVFFSLLMSAAAMFLYRHKPWKAALWVQLAFYSHYFGDYFFTRFPLIYFWPVWDRGFIFSHRIGLDHPINHAMGYASLAMVPISAWIWRRTPMELVWPELDRRIVNLLLPRRLTCHLCAKPANETCITCNRPVCRRHARLTGRMRVLCAACSPRRHQDAEAG